VQYEIEMAGGPRRVVVHRSGSSFTVEVDGKSWTVDAHRLGAHSLSLLVRDVRLKPDTTDGVASGSGRTLSYEVTVVSDATGQKVVTVGAIPIALALNGHRRAGAKGEGTGGKTGPQRLSAPMPGKVVRVLVKPGDEVSPRQPILVIEAMKMENELRAAAEGVISELHAKEGQSVEAGTLLAVIASRSQ
jgi:biotin carboxyl carrier protein